MKMRFTILASGLIAVAAIPATATGLTGMKSMQLSPKFDTTQFEYSEQGGFQTFVSRQTPAQREENQTSYVTVTFHSDHNPAEMLIFGMWAYNEDGFYYAFPGADGNYSATIPAGEYDFCCRYCDFTQTYNGFDVHERIVANEDMSLDFSPSNCVNTISFIPTLPNGDTMEVPEIEYFQDADGNWDTRPVKEGNVYAVGMQNSIIVDGNGIITGGYISATGGVIYPFDMLQAIHISNVSDRYTFWYNYLITGNDGEMSVVQNQVSGCGSDITMTNSATEYQTIQKDIYIDQSDEENPRLMSNCDTNIYMNGNYLGGWTGGYVLVNDESDKTTVWHIAQGNDGIGGKYEFVILPMPGLAFEKILDDSGYTKLVGISATPCGYVGGTLHNYYAAAGVYMYNISNAVDGESIAPTAAYPGVESFSFSDDETTLLPGATAPALTFKVQNYMPWQELKYFDMSLEYTGRLCELRTRDNEYMKIGLKYGGVEQEIPNYDELVRYPTVLANSGETDNKSVDITLSVSTEGPDNVTMSNEASIFFDLSRDDYVPPTLRMLQMRNTDNNITDTFDANETIRVAMTAGDFNFIEATGQMTCNPIEAKMEIATAGTDEWEEIVLTINNAESTANYGYFYEAELSDLAEGWHDVRISLKDMSDNTQQQIIRNVLKIKEDSGVSLMTTDSATTIDIYDLYGTCVARSIKKDSFMAPETGIYVVKDCATGRTYKAVF